MGSRCDPLSPKPIWKETDSASDRIKTANRADTSSKGSFLKTANRKCSSCRGRCQPRGEGPINRGSRHKSVSRGPVAARKE